MRVKKMYLQQPNDPQSRMIAYELPDGKCVIPHIDSPDEWIESREMLQIESDSDLIDAGEEEW